MKEEEKIATLIFDKFSRSRKNIDFLVSFISKKLKKKTVPFVGRVGKKLGKIILQKKFSWQSLFFNLWKKSLTKKRNKFNVPEKFEVFCLLINALSEILKKERKEVKNFVVSLVHTLDNWAVVDTLAIRVVASLAVEEKEEIFSLMKKWRSSKNKWVRRLSAVTITAFIRARPQEIKNCLNFLDKMMREKEIEVKKAIAWALREISKKNESLTFSYLQKWAKTKDKNATWIVKEGMKKLSEDKKKKLKKLLS